jgi:hypothetical protein
MPTPTTATTDGYTALRAFRAITLCSLYMVCGPALILLNQSIMKDHGFPYPLALSAVGLVSSAAVARFIVTMGWGEIREGSRRAVEGPAFWSKLAPVGASYACALGFGNSAYLYLDVGFVQMMKVSCAPFPSFYFSTMSALYLLNFFRCTQ